ncbi:MAG TPA: hypothetical protein VGO11_10760 [Chthoniobacteraceae bacterium]|jgi:hypothetical protein|nr:hypothetical protein [Chthoniobacteraceae bacterium]
MSDSRDDLLAAQPRYGTANPEPVENELWDLAISENWSGYALRQHLGVDDTDEHRRHAATPSTWREATPGPLWSWRRFGRTSTALGDGRVIHVAGEHEDHYDSDFCIYNDVVVDYAGGRREFFLYPKDVFPPTDFHTATLVGRDLFLIGSLGYHDLRRHGDTQVLKLDTRSLRIERIATRGEGPGWISCHQAELLDPPTILIVGGEVVTADDAQPNGLVFALDLATMTWRRREHGDTAVFPVTEAVYRGAKNPRFGAGDSERSNNPFWLAMAQRRWPPSRARLHFGDTAPPKPAFVMPEGEMPAPFTAAAHRWAMHYEEARERAKLVRTIDDVVWTAVREHALHFTLPDGRTLMIGGEVADDGDEYADPWVYNDVVVQHPGGAIDILTYPLELFPHARWEVTALMGAHLFIFGEPDRKRHPERSRRPVALRLDTATYAVSAAREPAPAVRVNFYRGCETRDGTRVILPVIRRTDADPELGVAFELEALIWSEPFPHPHPEGTASDGDDG